VVIALATLNLVPAILLLVLAILNALATLILVPAILLLVLAILNLVQSIAILYILEVAQKILAQLTIRVLLIPATEIVRVTTHARKIALVTVLA